MRQDIGGRAGKSRRVSGRARQAIRIFRRRGDESDGREGKSENDQRCSARKARRLTEIHSPNLTPPLTGTREGELRIAITQLKPKARVALSHKIFFLLECGIDCFSSASMPHGKVPSGCG